MSMKLTLKISVPKNRWVVAGIGVGILILAVGIFLYVRIAVQDSSDQNSAAQSIPAATSTADFLLYSNAEYHFSLLYPPSMQVHQYGGGGNALTIAFQDPTTNEGFQVFIVPYDKSQITAARFNEDEPSGVMQDPTDVIVDGVRATMFYSTDTALGDTREVWFINNGFLYEVTTYKELDAWLGGIMQTWKFD